MIERPSHLPAARAARLAALHDAAFAPRRSGWTADDIAAYAAKGGLLVDANDRGFALISMAADEAELLTIAVETPRQGLGAALLTSAIAAARANAAKTVFLEVNEFNASARALYARAGFSEIGRRKDYYADAADTTAASDALIMSLRV